jgi:hypothetical protein
MCSTWQNRYVVACLERGLKERFKDVQEESHILIFLKVILVPDWFSQWDVYAGCGYVGAGLG